MTARSDQIAKRKVLEDRQMHRALICQHEWVFDEVCIGSHGYQTMWCCKCKETPHGLSLIAALKAREAGHE